MAITRLNNNSITSVSALPNLASLPSGIPTGKILQVKTTGHLATFQSSTTGIVDITNGSLTITPNSTSSKIFCLVGGSTYANASNTWHYCKLWRSGIGSATQLFSQQLGGYGDSGQETNAIQINYTDSPSTTSELTYYVRADNNYAITVNYNPCLTLFEIAG